MDFFRKAHVVKLRKEDKSKKAMKKQLKVMLHGYKSSNRKLIKSCDDTHNNDKLDEDADSVSGFSDLNLTSSSVEDDVIQNASVERNEQNSSDGEINNDEDMECHNDNVTNSEDNNAGCASGSDASIDNISNKSTNNSEESMSQQNSAIADTKSISNSEDSTSPWDGIINKLSSDLSNNSSSESKSDITYDSNSNSETTEYDTNNSIFDDDGILASKINEQLRKKKVMKKTPRRKAVAGPKSLVNSENNEHIFNDNIGDLNETMSDSDSSPFISIQASDAQLECLSDIIGNYRHPTMKNVPAETMNIISTDTSGIFSNHYMNVEDVNIQEEVDNLMPKFDENHAIEDIDSEVISNTSTEIQITPASFDDTQSNDASISETASTKHLSNIYEYAKFENNLKIYYGNKRCIIVLKHPTEIYIHGKVNIKVLAGTVEVCGYRLKRDKPCEVLAPHYNYAYCIKTIDTYKEFNDSLFRKLMSEGLLVKEAEEIVVNEFDGVISLFKLNSFKMDFLENNLSPIDLFRKSNKNVNGFFKNVSDLLGCSLYFKGQTRTFEEPTCWSEVIKCGLKDNSRGIICGGKGVGKSTFLRYCVNSLLSRGPVLLIDLDPGQAEFTIAGNISATVVDKPLIGPSYTHLMTPNLMLNLGMINTMDNPRRYAAAVDEIITYCSNQERLKSMPWIVNTMGMTNAMGLKFITMIILRTRPTFLFEIDSKNPKKKFEMHLKPEVIRTLYQNDYKNAAMFANVTCTKDFDYRYIIADHVDNPVKKNYSLAARDERYFNVLSYFADLLIKNNKDELLSVVPYEVKLDDLYIGLNVKIDKDAVPKVINGKIVALCELATDTEDKVFSLKNKPLKCHGMGLIRGVDLERRMVYVITPIDAYKLYLVNTLVYADWMPEMRGAEKHLPNGITIPYRTNSEYHKRQLMHAPHRRFNPLQLLKMTRNS
ncbi:hypothetical protein ACJJTC_006912 [Scirpophaga incertulas]